MSGYTITTVDDIKQITSISRNISSELLEPYILISEEYFCYPILGSALVSEIKTQVTGGTGNTLTSLNLLILEQFIKPLVAYGAFYEYIPFSHIKTTQKGEVKQSSDNSTNADLNEIVFKRNALKDKVSFFQDRLKDYLEVNKSYYPLYRSTCSSNNNNGSGIYLGLYN